MILHPSRLEEVVNNPEKVFCDRWTHEGLKRQMDTDGKVFKPNIDFMFYLFELIRGQQELLSACPLISAAQKFICLAWR
jgi:hypothetical protein